MAFMDHHKEVDAETSEAMALRFRPIAPKPMPPPPAPVVLTDATAGRERDMVSYSSPPAIWWGTGGDGVAPRVMRGWYTSEGGFLSNCEEHLRRLSFEGSSSVPWVPTSEVERSFPIERDLISKLQVPQVIKPRPIRALRTKICIDCSSIFDSPNSIVSLAMRKKTVRQVEAELELPDALPAIVSGRYNVRVHLTNDAFKAMVGQPVCPWLDSLPGTGMSRRINGEVELHVRPYSAVSHRPRTGDAFPCTARISWDCEGAAASLSVPCAVEGLASNSIDDQCFVWRFDSRRASIMYCIV